MPTSRLIDVLRLYIEAGHLRPQPNGAAVQGALPANHQDFLTKQAFPASVRFLLKQQSFRMDEGLLRFKEIVNFLGEVVDLCCSWIDYDNVLMLGVLASVFDVQKTLFRASASQPNLDEHVRQLERDAAPTTVHWIDPIKTVQRVAWDHVNSRLVGVLATRFGTAGGFDALLRRLGGNPMPLEALKAIVKVFQRLRALAGEELLNRILPALPKLVFERQLLDLETDNLRRVTKKDIEELDRSMRTVLVRNADTNEKADEICDKFCLAFALKCLKSPLQDKKFSGLAHIEESIEQIGRDRRLVFRPPVTVAHVGEIEKKVATLLAWLRENRILELVFQRDNMRRELIVLTKKTVRFLYQECELDLCHVNILLDGILDHHHEKSKDVRDALYDTLIEAADRITNRDMGRLIWNTVRRMDPAKHYCARTVKLLRSVIDGTHDRAHALEMTSLIWSMVQDTSRAPMDAVQAALEALPRLAESMRIDFIPDSVSNLKSKRSGLQSLKLLWEIVSKTPKARRVDVAEQLVVDKEIFALAQKELAHYKRAARRRQIELGDGERDWDTEVLVGLFPHLEAVDTRLALLAQLTGEAQRLPEAEYLPELWKNTVSLYLTQKECEMGLTWLCTMCQYEPPLAEALFRNVFLQQQSLSIFTQSEGTFSCFMGLFYAVNHDEKNLRLKTRDNVLAFDEALDWPCIGIETLVSLLAHQASPELFARGQDIVINLHLTVAKSALHQTDKFRSGIARLIFDMLATARVEIRRNKDATNMRWVDRLIGLVKSLVVLTRPKEEPVPQAAPAGANGAASASPAPLDEEEDRKKPDMFVASMDRDKVQSFMEMMGEAFPEEYRYVMSALLVKEANWDANTAVNDFLMCDTESKVATTLEKAKQFRRHKGDQNADGGDGAAAAAKPAAVVEGTAMARLVGKDSSNYDTLFALLEATNVDREAIWSLLKMLPPDARLTRLLSDEMQGGSIEWAKVLGERASYQLLYSLELVRQSVPSEEDSEEEYVHKTEWCKAFVHRGGFSFLFVLLNRIATQKERLGRIEKACLSQLLKIVFFFMRSELDSTLAKSADPPGGKRANEDAAAGSVLFLSVASTNTLIGGAPFEELGVLMFRLLSERGKLPAAAVVPGAPVNPEDADDSDVARYAAYLLAGSVLKEPQLLGVLASSGDFGGQLRQLLCAHDATLRQHVASQLLHLCREYKQDATVTNPHNPIPFFLKYALSFVPHLLSDQCGDEYQRCGPVFALINDLILRVSDEDMESAVGSSAWVQAAASGGASEDRSVDRLMAAVCRSIIQRAGHESSAFGPEDQALAGLFKLAALLLNCHVTEEEAEKTVAVCQREGVVKAVLEDALFEKGSGTKCSTASTREAGLTFCAKLCRASSANWEYVVRFLSAHQLKQEPLSSWRPVEVAESKRTRFVGLRNLGATCYMNATLQQLFMMPELRNAVLSAGVPAEKRLESDMLWQFQRVMASLLHSDSTWADTEPFVKTLRDGMGEVINTSRQEDAYDFLTRFQEQLEAQMGGAQSKIFSKMFSVGMCQEIECKFGHAKATEQQAEPVLQVDFGPNIEAALDSTFGLGGDPISDYRCDGCGGKVDIVKRHMIHSSSDQLVVMLRRFEWDYFAAGNSRKKLQGHFEIPHRLNLSAYTESGIRQRRLGKQPMLKPEFEYELRGIVVHSGRTMDSGHYFSIIRDLDSGNWFKFDDREVTPFPAEWLNEKHSKFIGECYMLLFQRVNDDLSRSQHLLDSQSINAVDEAILREVEMANASVVGQRRFLEMPYFGFLQDIMQHAPRLPFDGSYDRVAWEAIALSTIPPPSSEKGKEEAVAVVPPPLPEGMEEQLGVRAAQMAAVFVWETWVRARQQVGEHRIEVLNLWTDQVLIGLFSNNVPACAWVAREMLTRRSRWLRYFLLESEEPWVRAAFHRWLCVVVAVLAKAEEEAGGLLRTLPLDDSTKEAVPIEMVGLTGRVIDAVMNMMEASRVHWRRFNEYFLTVRFMASCSEAARCHIACGVYPSYTRLMRPHALFVDYFMGEFSPFVRDLPYDRQDRAGLGNKMGGEQADLKTYFWAWWEILQAYDTGSYQGRVPMSQLDTTMWGKHDMLLSLIKQGYNPQVNGLMLSYFVYEHRANTLFFCKMITECYFKDSSAPIFEVMLALLCVRDSLRPSRINLIVSPFLQTLYERRTYLSHHQPTIAPQLLRLAQLLDNDSVLVSYMTSHRGKWDLWLSDYALKDKELVDRLEMLRAGMFDDARIDWAAALAVGATGEAGSAPLLIEEDTETEELLTGSTSRLVDSDNFVISSSENIMGVD